MNPVAAALPLALVAAVSTGAALQSRPRAPAPTVASAPALLRGGGSPAEGAAGGVESGVVAPRGVPAAVPRVAGEATRRQRARWAWPLTPRPAVVGPFVPPPTPYAAGHRGVDLAASPGQPVTAVDAGTVTHVGRVAGRGTVTVTHVGGLRSTYEPVTPSVVRGTVVAQAGALGAVAAGPSHCAPDTCLHLGALRGQVYLDPLRLLGGGRVRLLPLGQAPDG